MEVLWNQHFTSRTILPGRDDCGTGRRKWSHLHPGSLGSLNLAGCYLVSQCNVLRHLGIRMGRAEVTPSRFIERLQKKHILDVTGFTKYPGIDYIGLLTQGKVSLIAYEDWGRGGVPPRKSEILRHRIRRGTAAIANISTHEYLTSSHDTHYVLLSRRLGRNWEMHDPDSSVTSKRLLPYYKRVFQVQLYQRR